MRVTILIFALQLLNRVLAQQQSQPFGEYLARFPACANICAFPVIDDLGYRNGSTAEVSAALCPNISSMRNISSCIQTSCSQEDEIAAWPLRRELCNTQPIPTRAPYIRNLTIVMAALAATFVVLRIYSRTMVAKRFWWDDYNVAVAALFMIMIAVVMIWDSTIGLGLHAWDVESPDKLVTIAKVFLVMKIFYIIVQVLLKVSILVFYLRVFPVPWLENLTWIMIAFTVLHGVAFFFAIIFQCTPVNMLWNPRVQGHCIQLETIIFPGAIFSIVEDFAILLLPIPCLSMLKVGKGKKISLIAMFSVGFIACIISIIRVGPVLVYRDTLDQSWDTIHLLAWSEVELAVATICVCFPSLKPILNYHVPQYFGSGSSMGFVVSKISPEPPTSRDRDVINSDGSENKRRWLGSRLTLKSFGTFRSHSKKNSGGTEFASGDVARQNGTMVKTEVRGWSERGDDLEQGLSVPSRSQQMLRRPSRVVGEDDVICFSIDSDRGRWMDKDQRIRHLSQATCDFSDPRSTTGSRPDEWPFTLEATCDLSDPRGTTGSRPDEWPFTLADITDEGHIKVLPLETPGSHLRNTSESTEVPLRSDAGNCSRSGHAGRFDDSDTASDESSQSIRSGRVRSWDSVSDPNWKIRPLRLSGFRISAFESGGDGSSLAKTILAEP